MVALMLAFSAVIVVYFAFFPLLALALWLSVLFALCLVCAKRYLLAILVLLGVSAGYVRALLHEQQHVDMQFDDVVVVGEVISIPRYHYHATQFNVAVTQIDHHPTSMHLQLWWRGRHDLQVKDHWQLRLHYQQPRSSIYSHWLAVEGLQAQAHVRSSPANRLLSRTPWYQSIDVSRQQLSQHIHAVVSDPALAAVLVALSTGSRHYLLPQHWRVFQRTGTSHLIAISGLHVGLVAGIFYVITEWLWCRSDYLMLLFSAKKAASVSALLMATLYACFAGLSLPTQRALLMITVMLAASFFNRHVPLWYRCLLAFSLSLLLWPMAVLSIGFWLSHCAVWLIAWCFSARLTVKRGFLAWCYLQYAMFIGLLPMTLLFFERFSSVMMPANYIAVPYMSFLVVPCCLLASLTFFVAPSLSAHLWSWTATILAPLWYYLNDLAALPGALWQHTLSSAWVMLSLMLAALLLLLPRNIPFKYLIPIFMLAVFL